MTTKAVATETSTFFIILISCVATIGGFLFGFDSGVINGTVDGEITVQKSGEEIFQKIINVASGEKTKSEELGYGDNEFTPWKIGAVY